VPWRRAQHVRASLRHDQQPPRRRSIFCVTGKAVANRWPGRWRVTALPSRSPDKHGKFNFLGTSRLQLRLERMASLPPQSWEIKFDATRHLHVAPLLEAALADS
jgi:hypothetical protein